MSTFSLILPSRDPTSTPPAATNKAMSSTPSDLTGLRRRLDEIDDRLQDLLIDRAEIVAMVAASKRGGDQPAFQPAREAEIIRRLAGRHHGVFPLATLVRMWREMLAATVRLQSLFSVAVFAPCERPGLWDLARDHYGSTTAMAAYDATYSVIRAVADGEASIGVLPMPRVGEPDPWWPLLLSADALGPQVVARLPFGARGNARTKEDALAIGIGARQASGLDRTLLATVCAPEVTEHRILRALSATGLVCTFAYGGDRRDPANLVEVEGVVPLSDARLDEFHADLGAALRRVVPIGGYALPLPPAALSRGS
jgi:chorismate mutase/prephenate dehydratase